MLNYFNIFMVLCIIVVKESQVVEFLGPKTDQLKCLLLAATFYLKNYINLLFIYLP